MAIVNKKKSMEGKMKSLYNLQKLLLPTEFHPDGRVRLDPKTRMPEGPHRDVVYDRVVKLGGVGPKVKVDVLGGHGKRDGSVWRTGLGGPAKYFWRIMRDELVFRFRGSRSTTAVELTDPEYEEARLFVSFLLLTKQEDKTALPENFLSMRGEKKHGNGKEMTGMYEEIDQKFYEWLEKQDLDKIVPAKVTDIFALLPA